MVYLTGVQETPPTLRRPNSFVYEQLEKLAPFVARRNLSRQEFFNLVHNVVNANDIVDVVSEHVALRRSGKNFIGLCPFHKEKTPSFNVSPERQIFKCFGCGAGGDGIKFLQNILNVSFREALEVLARRAGIEIERTMKRTGSSQQGPSRTDIFRANAWAAETYGRILFEESAGQAGKQYLVGRGLTESTCRSFGLGFAPAGGRVLLEQAGRSGMSPELLSAAGLATRRETGYADMFRERVTFPIHDATSNVIGFGGRALGDGQPKYLNTPETSVFQKGRGVFGLARARSAIQETKQVVVVEGYTDVMATHQGGVANVVATLGTALTDDHARLLGRYADEIVLIFDGDQAGERAAERALSVFLTLGIDVKVARLPAGTDPFDLVLSEGGDAFSRVISASEPALEYVWSHMRSRYDGSDSTRGRRAAIDELLRVIASCDSSGRVDAIQRGMVLGRLSGLLSVPVAELGRQLQRLKRRTPSRAVSEDAVRSVCLPAPQTPAEAALKELLEVLVCEPGYIGGLTDVLRPADFENDTYRRVAECLWQAHSQLGEFTLAELISTVEEVALSDIITGLHREGSERGNFAETVEQALRCIEDYRREQEAGRIAAGMSNDLSDDEVDIQLQKLQKNLSGSVRRTPGVLID